MYRVETQTLEPHEDLADGALDEGQVGLREEKCGYKNLAERFFP